MPNTPSKIKVKTPRGVEVNVDLQKVTTHPEKFMKDFAGGQMTVFKNGKATTIDPAQAPAYLKQGYGFVDRTTPAPLKPAPAPQPKIKVPTLQDYAPTNQPQEQLQQMVDKETLRSARKNIADADADLDTVGSSADWLAAHTEMTTPEEQKQVQEVQKGVAQQRRIEETAKQLAEDVNIKGIMDEANKEAAKQFSQTGQQIRSLDPLGYAADPLAKIVQQSQQANKQVDPDKLVAETYRQASAQFRQLEEKNRQRFIQEAKDIGIPYRDYVEAVGVNYLNKAAEAMHEALVQQGIPKTRADWYVEQLKSSIVGNLASGAVTTGAQKEVLAEAKARNEMGEGFQPTMVDRALGVATSLAPDAPVMMGFGAGVNTAMRGLGLLSKAAVASNTIRVANATLRNRFYTAVAPSVFNVSANLSLYEGAASGINYLNTNRHISFSEFGSYTVEGMGHGAVSGALIGAFGKLYNNIFSPYLRGVTGLETSFTQKLMAHGRRFVYHTGALAAETAGFVAGGAATGEYSDKQLDIVDVEEKALTVIALKASPQHAAKVLTGTFSALADPRGAVRRFWNRPSDAYLAELSPEVRKEIDNARGSTKFFDYVDKILQASEKLANEKAKVAPGKDPVEESPYVKSLQLEYNRLTRELSWDAQNALNTIMFGVTTATRPRMQYITKRDGKLYEMSKDDQTLSVFKPADPAEEAAWIKTVNNRRTQNDVKAAFYAASQRMFTEALTQDPSDQSFRNLLNNFMTQHPELPMTAKTLSNVSKPGTRESKMFMAWMLDNSTLYRKLREAGFADRDIQDILEKKPQDLTDEDITKLNQINDISRQIAFPKGDVHPEQAKTDGENAAEKAGLGTDTPNTELINGLSARISMAEQRLSDFIKAGGAGQLYQEYIKSMTPEQAYFTLFSKDGYTEEQLAPIAEYINATAAQQGIMERTEMAIEENAEEWVQQVKYQPMGQQPDDAAAQVIAITDKTGNTLYIKAGEFQLIDNGDGTTRLETDDAGILVTDKDGNHRIITDDEVTSVSAMGIDDAREARKAELEQINQQAIQATQQQQPTSVQPPKIEQPPKTEQPPKSDDVTDPKDLKDPKDLGPTPPKADTPPPTPPTPPTPPEGNPPTPPTPPAPPKQPGGNPPTPPTPPTPPKKENGLKYHSGFVPSDKVRKLEQEAAQLSSQLEDLNKKLDELRAKRTELTERRKQLRGKRRQDVTEELEGVRKEINDLLEQMEPIEEKLDDAAEEWREANYEELSEHLKKMSTEELVAIQKKLLEEYGDSEGIFDDPEENAINGILSDRDDAPDHSYTYDRLIILADKYRDLETRRRNDEDISDEEFNAIEKQTEELLPELSNHELNELYSVLRSDKYIDPETGEGLDVWLYNEMEKREMQHAPRKPKEPIEPTTDETTPPTGETPPAGGKPADVTPPAGENPPTPKTTREQYTLTEDQIKNAEGLTDDMKDAAIDYLNGEDSVLGEAIYKQIALQQPETTPAATPAASDVKDPKAPKDLTPNPPKTPKSPTKPTRPKTPTQTAEDIAREEKQNKIDAQGPTISQADAQQQRIDDLKKQIADKLRGFGKKGQGELPANILGMNKEQMQTIVDVIGLSAQLGFEYIKKGYRSFEAFSKKLNEDIGDLLRGATGWTEKDMNEFYSDVWKFKVRDEKGERKPISQWAEEADKADYDAHKDADKEAVRQNERRVQENNLIVSIENALRNEEKLDIRKLRKLAKDNGMKLAGEDVKDGVTDTDLQEFAELAAVSGARKIIQEKGLTKEAYDDIVKLYNRQPTVTVRDSEKIKKQQFSTPSPMAAIMALFSHEGKKPRSVLEPSAGNGALVLGFDNTIAHVNDIDPVRLDNLHRQGFKTVSSQDGTLPFAPKAYDVVVTNPPFSKPNEVLPAKEVTVGDRVYKLTSLDQQMAANALDSMKDDGRACIIIGGNTAYNPNGSLKGKDLQFLSFLYDQYNVTDIINFDGAMYAKNGTKFPVRMILIDGRRTDTSKQRFAPVRDKADAEPVKSYEELYKRYEKVKERLNNKDYDLQVSDDNPVRTGDGVAPDKGRPGRGGSDRDDQKGTGADTRPGGAGPQLPVRLGTDKERERTATGQVAGEADEERPGDTQSGSGEPHDGDRPGTAAGASEAQPADDAGADVQGGTKGQPAGRPGQRGDGHADTGHGTQPGGGGRPAQPGPDRPAAGGDADNLDKVEYSPVSNGNKLGVKTPAKNAADVRKALQKIKDEHGDIDEFVRKRLGYDSKVQLYKALAADQIDGVAMAIYQMEHGSGFIIGDGTGVGKGRQAAALLIYGMRQGKVPVFVTQNPKLFADIYRDMKDMGMEHMFHPLIVNKGDADVNIKDEDTEEILFRGLGDPKDINGIYNNGKVKLPAGTTLVLLSYSQVNTGHTEFVDGREKPKKKKSGKFTAAENNGQVRRDFLQAIAKDNIVVLDESHMASGAAAGYFMKTLGDARGVTFLSGTFAKRPDSMPVYAQKTIMSAIKGRRSIESMLDAIRRGGPILQEVMSEALFKAGQMIRRERPTEGVVNNWVKNPDPDWVKFEREASDKLTSIFRDMANFQRDFIDPYLDIIRTSLAGGQGQAKKGNMGLSTTNFASNTYNLIRQMSFALKAKHAADMAIKALKEGRKPVIAVSNTFEAFQDDLPLGEEIDMPDFSATMERKLATLLSYRQKVPGSKESVKVEIPLKQLPEEAQAAYNKILAKIQETSSGLSISPIDQIIWTLNEAGYTVGELTGRGTMIEKRGDKVVRRNRTEKEKDSKQIVYRFNNTVKPGDMVGELDGIDAVILNKSSATGISLHASGKFANSDTREMIIAQLEADINDAIQMLGRINRTGQVSPPIYTYLTSNIPAENRLLMMYKAKIKSLFANTTASQDAKDNEVEVVDMLNKYGDQIALQYMIEHPDVVARMFDPFNMHVTGNETVEEMEQRYHDTLANIDQYDQEGTTMSKFMARLATLSVEEQERITNEVEEIYNNKIEALNEAGENTLVATELPLNAKTISRQELSKGTNPESGNPFEDNVYAEIVEVDVLSKPMTTAEIQKEMKKLSEGKEYDEFLKEKLEQISKKEEDTVAQSNKRIENNAEAQAKKARNLHIKGLKKDREDKKNNYTDEEIQISGDRVYETTKEEILSTKPVREREIRSQFQEFKGYLQFFKPGAGLSIPTKEDVNATDKFRPGMLIGFKFGKSLTPKATMAVFATADGRRKESVPLGDRTRLRNIAKASQTFANETRVIKLGPNWDKWNASTPAREQRVICNGNILEMLIDNPNGKIIRYTTQDGEIKTGVLMQKDFVPVAKKPMSEAFSDLANGKQVASVDGTVLITPTRYGFNVVVPRDRKTGGKIYLDDDILQCVDYKNFFSNGGTSMAATVSSVERLQRLLGHLDRLGYTTPKESDIKPSFHKVYQKEAAQNAEKVSLMKVVRDRVVNIMRKAGIKVSTDWQEGQRVLDSLKIGPENNIKFFRTKSGDVYGFAYDGKIYIDPRIVDSAETPIHEYTHLWAQAIRQSSQKKWAAIVKLMKGQKELWKEISDQYSDLTSDDDIAEEAIAMFSGRRGNERLIQQAERAFSNPSLARRAVDAVRNAVRDFWRATAEKLGIPFTSAEHIADKALKDLLAFRNPNDLKNLKDLKDLTRNDPLATAARIAGERRQEKLRQRTKQEIGASGKTFEEIKDGTPEQRQVMFAMVPQYNDVIGQQQRIIYETQIGGKGAPWKEAHFDFLRPLRALQEALTGKAKEVLDAHNVYDRMKTLRSVIGQQQIRLRDNQVKAFYDAVSLYVKEVMQNKDLGRKDAYQLVKEQLYAMSGLERNRILFIRDFIDKQRNITPSVHELTEWENAEYERLSRGVDWDAMTEEEAEKKAAQLAKQAHQNWIDYLQQEWYDVVSTARDDSFDGYLDRLDDFIHEFSEYDPTEKANDRSGVNNLAGGFDDSGHFDERAIRDDITFNGMAMGLEDDAIFTPFDFINNISKHTIDKQFESGLIDRKYKNHLEKMMAFYLPMRKWDETMAEDVYGYQGSDFDNNDNGRINIKAKGRHSLPQDPLINLVKLANQAITLGERNKAKNALLRLVNATYNPEDKTRLVTKSETWLEMIGKDPAGNDVWDISEPDIKENMTPQQIADEFERWEQDMKQKRLLGTAKVARGRLSIPYKFEKKSHERQHAVVVYANGKPVTLWINSNPRAAMSINGALTPGNNNVIDKYIGGFARYMSASMTSWSPSFALRNPLRDLNFGLWNVYAKEGAGYAAKDAAQWFKNIGRFSFGGNTFGGYLSLYRKGVAPKTKYQEYFKEFMDNGGRTGYVNNYTIDKAKKDLEAAINTSNWKKIKKGARAMTLGLMEEINDRAENLMRFATYATSRNAGKTILQAIEDAKDVSTNFDVKGSRAKAYVKGDVNSFFAGYSAELLNHLYLFVNPAMQSLAILGRDFKHHPVRAAAGMLSHMAVSALWPTLMGYLAYEIFGEDESAKNAYENLPEWDRRANACFYLGNGKWFKLPLGIETSAAWALGQIYASYCIPGCENTRSSVNPTLDIASVITQLSPVDPLSTDGKSLIVSLSPYMVAPVVQAYENKKWTGAPIEMQEEKWNKTKPKWTRAFRSTSPLLVSACREMATWFADEGADPEIESGPFDFSPGKIETLMRGYFGGYGVFASDVASLASGDVNSKRLPAIKGVFTTTDQESEDIRISAKYRAVVERVEAHKQVLDGYKKKDEENSSTDILGRKKYNDPVLHARRVNLENKWGKEIEIIKEAKKMLKEPQNKLYHPANEEEKAAYQVSVTDIKRQALISLGEEKQK